MPLQIYNPDSLIARLEKYSIYSINSFIHPTLGVIIKSDASESDRYYLRSLEKKAKKYGAEIIVANVDKMYDAAISIQKLRENINVAGIIILSSFGEDADRALADMIPSRLDIDCVSSVSLGQLITSNTPIGFRKGPCTSIACYKIIEDYCKINDFSKKNIAVVSRSLRVGRPLAEMLTQHNATVTVFHSKSELPQDFSDYNIVVLATGRPEWFDESYCQRYSDLKLIIDVSTIETDKGLVGDVDLQSFYDEGYGAENCNTNLTITSVPGGVGKLTPVILFAKLFQNAAMRLGKTIEEVY